MHDYANMNGPLTGSEQDEATHGISYNTESGFPDPTYGERTGSNLEREHYHLDDDYNIDQTSAGWLSEGGIFVVIAGAVIAFAAALNF